MESGISISVTACTLPHGHASGHVSRMHFPYASFSSFAILYCPSYHH